MIELLRAPEAPLRALAVGGAVLAAAAPPALLAPGAPWWQRPLPLLAATALGVGLCLRGEARPELQDGELAVRARRLCPMAIGALAVACTVFPHAVRWPVVWVLAWLAAALLPFAAQARVRAVCLVVASAGALAAVVLDERTAPALLGVGSAWVLVPALGRARRLRLQLSGARGRPPGVAALGAPLAVGGIAALAGVGVAHLLPPSTRRFPRYELLAPPTAANPTPPAGEPLHLPQDELIVLGVLSLVLVLFVLSRPRRGDELPEAPDALGRPVGPPAPIPPDALAPPAPAWPAGPRRDLVEAYLAHRERLRALGHAPSRRGTPHALADRLAPRLSPSLQQATRRVASWFAGARWSSAPVTEEALDAARRDLTAIEAALGAPSDAGGDVGSGSMGRHG